MRLDFRRPASPGHRRPVAGIAAASNEYEYRRGTSTDLFAKPKTSALFSPRCATSAPLSHAFLLTSPDASRSARPTCCGMLSRCWCFETPPTASLLQACVQRACALGGPCRQVAGRRASSRYAGRHASSRYAGRRASSRYAGRHASSRYAGRRASPPYAGRRASSRHAGRRAFSRHAGRRASSRRAGRSNEDTSVGKRKEQPAQTAQRG